MEEKERFWFSGKCPYRCGILMATSAIGRVPYADSGVYRQAESGVCICNLVSILIDIIVQMNIYASSEFRASAHRT